MAVKLVVHRDYQVASFAGAPLPLTRLEYRVLELLIENAGRVVSRKMFFDRLYRYRAPMPEPKILAVLSASCVARSPTLLADRITSPQYVAAAMS